MLSFDWFGSVWLVLIYFDWFWFGLVGFDMVCFFVCFDCC